MSSMKCIFVCTRLKITSFCTLSFQLIFSILLQHQYSKAFTFFRNALLQVQLSYPLFNAANTKRFSIFIFVLNLMFLLTNTLFCQNQRANVTSSNSILIFIYHNVTILVCVNVRIASLL